MNEDSFYAVRRGKHGLRSCIFVNYKDCKKFLVGYKRAEFELFGNVEEAALYLSTNDKKSKKARARSTSQHVEWHGKFKLLQAYREKHGHCDVPQLPVSPLLVWIFRQIREYRKIKTFQRSELTLGRVQLLIDEGFNFHRARNEISWNDRLLQLQKFKKKHKHTNVMSTHPQLGQFVVRQVSRYFRNRVVFWQTLHDKCGLKMKALSGITNLRAFETCHIAVFINSETDTTGFWNVNPSRERSINDGQRERQVRWPKGRNKI